MRTIQQYWLSIWAVPENSAADSWQQILPRAVSILFLYILSDSVIMAMTRLPVERYFEPVIFVAFLKHLLQGKYVLVLVPLILGVLFFKKNIAASWTAFPMGKSVRSLVVLVTAVLAWVFATADFNLFFNQGYYADRLFLLILMPLVCWRPVFVLPFLLILLPAIGQSQAITGFSWAAPYLLIRVLILFAVFFLLFLATKKFYLKDFILFLGSLIAAHYWLSGFGKLNGEWIGHDQIFFLLPATYANGWMPFVEPETIGAVTQTLSQFNTPVKMLVLVFELGGCLFFFHRYSARFFLTGWMLMHLGIFLVSGICFWMWAVLEAGLMFLFFRKNGFAELPVFSKKHLLISAFLVMTGVYWCRPVKLAWHDVPVSYTYRFEAATETGEILQLPPDFFGTFDYQFTLGTFSYLKSEPSLVITWGGTDAGTSRLLRTANSSQQFLEIEKSHGAVRYVENQAIVFDNFMKKYLANWNKRHSGKTFLSYFKAPRLLWTFPKAPPFEGHSVIRKVRVVQVTSFYQDGKYEEIRALPIREISIP